MDECKRTFCCAICNLTETYHPFDSTSSSLTLIEDAYVMKDPFSDGTMPLILGSNCVICGKCVCVSSGCSVFYVKRFCSQCFKANLNEFPAELQKQVKLQPKGTQ